MVEDLVDHLKKCDGYDLLLFFSPSDQEQLFQSWLGHELPLIPQKSGDLGQRMKTAFQEALDLGYIKILLTGSDIPELSSDLIFRAFENLGHNDVVLGPAEDGGYYLIGMKQIVNTLFDNMVWSTDSVFDETLARLRLLNLDVAILKKLSDVDTIENLEALHARLGGLPQEVKDARYPRLIKEMNNIVGRL